MANLREVLRLHQEKRMSSRNIARALGISKSSVSNYLALAERVGIRFDSLNAINDDQLESILGIKETEKVSNRALPDFSVIYDELQSKGVTLNILWSEYRERFPDGYSYSRFCHHFNEWLHARKLSMRQTHKAGEKMFIDFAGKAFPIKDKTTGLIWEAPMFVAVLGASSYVYAEALKSQALEHWMLAHISAFEFLGGAPEILVPDNLKSAVTKADRYEPEINRTYQEMARHYGTVVIPARVRKPKDKPKAEVEVKHTTSKIIAELRKRTFFSLEEANAAIRLKLEELNRKNFQKRNTSRQELFEKIDKPALKPLPLNRYSYTEWLELRVAKDYHIDILGNFYSVPHSLVSQLVEVKVGLSSIEIFWKGERMALHRRLYGKAESSTLKEHMPKTHLALKLWSRQQLLERAKSIGPNTHELVMTVMDNSVHEELAKRSASGILSQEKYYPGRLEAAAKRAVHSNTCSLSSVRSILKGGLDKIPIDDTQEEIKENLVLHKNVRGRKYFAS